MSWITLKTTQSRWEAELMQEILTAYYLKCRQEDSRCISPQTKIPTEINGR